MTAIEIIVALEPLEVEALRMIAAEVDRLLAAKTAAPAEPPIAPEVTKKLDDAAAKLRGA